jgi:hypothetical protein
MALRGRTGAPKRNRHNSESSEDVAPTVETKAEEVVVEKKKKKKRGFLR